MGGLKAEDRRGGKTIRISRLNTVYVDDHKSWYAVHWNTHLGPVAFVDNYRKEFNFHDDIPVIIQSHNTTSTETMGELAGRIYDMDENSIEFLRFDARGFSLVWEPSAEYQHVRQEVDVLYTAITGFGSDVFDGNFIQFLLQHSGTQEIRGMTPEIVDSLAFLMDSFQVAEINPWGDF